jgi:MarR family transcriptional regulator, lower aerobic nicotinate degradation pathway regulator
VTQNPTRPPLSDVDALAQLSFAVQSALERRASAHGVSIVQTRLLGILRDREPTMNELGRLLELDKSSVSGLVDRAERRGHVERMPSSRDRRVVLVRLTEVGRTLVAEVAALFATDIAELLDPLPAPRRAALTAAATDVLAAHASRHGIDPVTGGALG